MVGDSMNSLVIILLIIALIAGLLLIFTVNYNKLKWINIKVEKGEMNISSLLEKKYEILLRYISLLKENITINENDFDNINITSNDIILFNKDLNDIDNKVNNYLDNNEKILKKDNIKKINKELKSLNISLKGCIKYYNDNIDKNNQLCKSFPSSIISKIFKYKEKEYIENNIVEELKILNEEK